MTSADDTLFECFTAPLIGMVISHIWSGYGSAIFIEFGELTPIFRLDGRASRNPQGEMALHAVEGWRVEGKRRIWTGSWSEKERWPRVFSCMKGSSVVSATRFGNLSEINLLLSNGLRFVTFMTNSSDPDWSLMNREHKYLHVCAGRLAIDERNFLRRSQAKNAK